TPDRNLLSIGASSLDLVRIVARFEAQFGVRPSIQEFFAAPTVAALAQTIAQHTQSARGAGAANGSAPTGPRRKPDVILDPSARQAFHAQNLSIRTFPADWGLLALPDGPSLAPPSPDLFERRSVRQFRAEPVPLDHLGGWLAALRRRMLGDKPKHAYGSAAGCSPGPAHVAARRPSIIAGAAGACCSA